MIWPGAVAATAATAIEWAVPSTIPLSLALRQSAAYCVQWLKYAISTPVPDYSQLSTLALTPFAAVTSAALIGLPLLAWATYPLFNHSIYGSAKWGDIDDAEEQGLDGATGSVYGQLSGKILKPKAERNSIIIAPTRRGKTRGIVIPTILDYPGTIIAISTKSELAEHCADYRATLGPVHIIRWADPDTPSGWGFADLRNLPHSGIGIERHAAQAAGLLFPDDTKGENAIFAKQARIMAGCLFEFFFLEARRKGETITVSQMLSHKADTGLSWEEYFGHLAAEVELRGYPTRLHAHFGSFSEWDPKALSPFMINLIAGLDILTLASVQRAVSSNSFSLPDLRDSVRTIFIEFPQSDAKAFGPLTSLFFNAVISFGLDNPPKGSQVPIKIVADEFKSLPMIPNLTDLYTSGAGNSITMDMILQDFSSVIKVYGKESLDEFMTNATYLMAFGQNNMTTQKILSEKVGQETRKRLSTTTSFRDLFGGSRSVSLEGQPLVRPEDWGGIPFGNHVILTDGHMQKPLYVKTPFWDQIPTYRNRVPSSCLIKS